MRRFGVVPRGSFLVRLLPSLPLHRVVHVKSIRSYHVQSVHAGVVPAASTSSWSERVTSLFSEGFKGMENFLPVRSRGNQRKSTASPLAPPPSPPPPPPPLSSSACTMMNTPSSSLPLTFCNSETQKTLTARDLFPDLQSLFPDVKLSTTSSTRWANNGMGVPPIVRERLDCEHAEVGQHEQNFSQKPQSDYFPRISRATGPSSMTSAKEYEDAKRYAYAYEIWRHRNELLQHMQSDLIRLNDGIQYLRTLQEEDLEHAMRRATKFSFFVFFPFVLLTTIILFSESAFYSAELKHLRLVDYDEWLKKQNGVVDSSDTISKIRK
ncbi:uncharacterized protein TM35_000011930 [Trypanosoma theileri]|uniref:Transmembrane protein n=1 Tax=Trypanosoma theileri TaxID=67003 RepID=A0A1X0P8Q3_9TRYP|nr:uncharacterized protein TM35_000011930 [Trypanosoma theileri]ORC93316.1 hypothetical protein TM35_000011930 [Trypanosoma theileri]